MSIANHRGTDRKGFWEIVLARSTSHGKLRGLLNNWLPSPDTESSDRGTDMSLSEAILFEAHESQIDSIESQFVKKCAVSQRDHDEMSSSSGSETAPTGGIGLHEELPSQDLGSSPLSPLSIASSPRALGNVHQHVPSLIQTGTPNSESRLRACSECQQPIEGAVFMLNDMPYCCQRHRLSAYHKRRDQEHEGTKDRSGSGLYAKFASW